MRRTIFTLALTTAFGYGQDKVCEWPGDHYQGIPRSAAVFPVAQEKLFEWMGCDARTMSACVPEKPGGVGDASLLKPMNIPALRLHAWQIFDAITRDSRHRKGGNIVPVWETWYTIPEVFNQPSQRLLHRPMAAPQQLLPEAEHPFAEARVPAMVASVVRYNRSACSHIVSNGFNSAAKLNELAQAAKNIKDFPNDAIAVKTTWWLIRQSGCTAVPVWDLEPGEDGRFNSPKDWRRKVAVHMTAAGDAAECQAWRSVPLSDFYNVRIEAEELAGIRKIEGLEQAAVGDSLALVGLHFTTREIPDWVWATFWWHDRPAEAPYGHDRPRTLDRRRPWRNYRMDVAYDMDRPYTADGNPKATYNPYLEGALEDGIRSNCMTCHRRAAWTADKLRRETVSSAAFARTLPLTQVVVRGRQAANTTYFPEFDSLLKLDFMWTLAIRAK